MENGPLDRRGNDLAERLHLEHLLTEREQELAAVPALEARIADLESALVAAHDQTAAARRRAEELDHELTRSVRAMTEMVGSASWQLTRPLRRAQKILR